MVVTLRNLLCKNQWDIQVKTCVACFTKWYDGLHFVAVCLWLYAVSTALRPIHDRMTSLKMSLVQNLSQDPAMQDHKTQVSC